MGTTPLDIAKEYVSCRMLSKLHEQQILRVAGRLPSLEPAVINLYLKSRMAVVSSVTVANERRIIVSLWRFAFDEGIVESPPRRVMKLRAAPPPVVAWTIADLQTLVNTIPQMRQSTLQNGLSKGLFLETWVRIAYDTGARYGDVFQFGDHHLHGDVLTWRTGKTGVACSRPLSDETMEVVRTWMREKRLAGAHVEREPWLSCVCCRRYSFTIMRKLLLLAGLDGSSKWLRRSAATHVESQRPGAAQHFLGHTTSRVAEAHYLDRSQLAVDLPRPYRLTE